MDEELLGKYYVDVLQINVLDKKIGLRPMARFVLSAGLKRRNTGSVLNARRVFLTWNIAGFLQTGSGMRRSILKR